MANRKLDFYFDFISHNAYIAWHEIKTLCEKHDLELNPIPVLFAGFLAEHKQLGPAEIEPKGRWMTIDVIRKAKLINLPLNPPASHPFNPLLSLRVSVAAADHGIQREIIDQLFSAVWARGLDVTDPAVVAANIGTDTVDGQTLVDGASDDSVKTKLKWSVQTAIERGVFGVPTMMIDDQIFWGYDDFSFLELYLRGEDPLEPGELERWSNVRSTAPRVGSRG